ncbi:MAG: IucA/IucC family protein [Paenibacillus sp.]|nr:IucA/IucC family protein [Paenibacillus sp.]
MPENGSLFDDPPRHVSALIRIYPPDLVANPDIRFIPMSSLSSYIPVRECHFFDEWMQFRGMLVSQQSVEELFAEVCLSFFEVVLRLFRIGLLPEIHGQNSILI